MSPGFESKRLPYAGFPRVSGDEPSSRTDTRLLAWFSPRERG